MLFRRSPARRIFPEALGAQPAAHRTGVPPWLCIVVQALGIIAVSSTALAATAVVDLTNRQQIIRGFGGVVAWLPPFTDQEMDLLYGNEGPGQIGFTIFRARIAPDGGWTDEIANMQKAAARGALVIASPWSPPAAMKTINNVIGGSLRTDSYRAYADYLNSFVSYSAAHGVPLHAISLQNEPDWEPDYEGCVWTAQNFLTFCRDHAGTITTRVIMPESLDFNHAFSDATLNDPVAAANIDIIGGHIYGGGTARYPLAEAKGKEVWMTEHLELTTDWAGALQTAREIHDCLAVANYSAYLWWYLKRFYGPLDDNLVVTKRGFVMAQYSKFVRPGYVRVGATSNPTPGIYVSAYKGPKIVIVAINTGSADASQAFTIQSGSGESFTPWVTSGAVSMSAQPPVTASGGTFTAVLPAGSITTFVQDLSGAGPAFSIQPQHQLVSQGASVSLGVATTSRVGEPAPSFEWRRNGILVPGASSSTLTLTGLQPEHAGVYAAVAASGAARTESNLAVLGISGRGTIIGAGVEFGADIVHRNGRVFDQALLTGAAATITADHLAGQITRVSFIDLDDDIVQVELSGAGSLSLVLENPSGPDFPVNYNQDVRYMKGHAGIVISGADESTHVSVFTVGRATAFDPGSRYDFLQSPSAANNPSLNSSPFSSGMRQPATMAWRISLSSRLRARTASLARCVPAT